MKIIVRVLSLAALMLTAAVGFKKWYERVIKKSITAPDRHTSGPDTPANVRKRAEDLLADEDRYAHTPA